MMRADVPTDVGEFLMGEGTAPLRLLGRVPYTVPFVPTYALPAYLPARDPWGSLSLGEISGVCAVL